MLLSQKPEAPVRSIPSGDTALQAAKRRIRSEPAQKADLST